jgi:hypothetical protein
MGWTRRAVIGSGCGVAGTLLLAGRLAATPAPQAAAQRIGLLQAVTPWLDPRDAQGSLQRAVHALRTTLDRHLDAAGPLDWLIAGAVALPDLPMLHDPAAAAEALQDLAALATLRRLRITVGAGLRLVEFAPDGSVQLHSLQPAAQLAAGTLQLRLQAAHGHWIAQVGAATPPWIAPHAGGPFGGGTRIEDEGGRLIAATQDGAEALLTAPLPLRRYS